MMCATLLTVRCWTDIESTVNSSSSTVRPTCHAWERTCTRQTLTGESSRHEPLIENPNPPSLFRFTLYYNIITINGNHHSIDNDSCVSYSLSSRDSLPFMFGPFCSLSKRCPVDFMCTFTMHSILYLCIQLKNANEKAPARLRKDSLIARQLQARKFHENEKPLLHYSV